MRFRYLILLAPLFLGGCKGVLCDLLGTYLGQFTGDAEGTVDLSISEGDTEAEASLTLSSDSLNATGNGSFDCASASLDLTLTDEGGNEIGDFEGSLEDMSGHWSLITGESGTWSVGPVEE